MQTARMTVLMTPERKAAIESDAMKMGVSSGEYIRLAVDNFEHPAERREFEELAADLRDAMPSMLADFDAINLSISEARAAIDTALRATGERK